MSQRKTYAYGIFVKGRKRIGGTIGGESMDDAVRNIAHRNGLTLQPPDPDYPYAHPADTEWIFDGNHAQVYVWAPPRHFLPSDVPREPRTESADA
jgi:hypothetical protein